MLADYNELGTGVVSNYYTQDFAAGTLDVEAPVAMGIHDDPSSLDSAVFWADWQDEAAPAKLAVVLNGFGTDMELIYGEDTLGIFTVEKRRPTPKATKATAATSIILPGKPPQAPKVLFLKTEAICMVQVVTRTECGSTSNSGAHCWTKTPLLTQPSIWS